MLAEPEMSTVSFPVPVVTEIVPVLAVVTDVLPEPPVKVVEVAAVSLVKAIFPVATEALTLTIAAMSDAAIVRSPAPLIFKVFAAPATKEPMVFAPVALVIPFLTHK